MDTPGIDRRGSSDGTQNGHMGDDEISYHLPSHPTKKDLEAQFYHECQLRGLQCHLPYSRYRGFGDALVLDRDHRVIAMIQFQTVWNVKHLTVLTPETIQAHQSGIPSAVITHPSQIRRVVEQITQENAGD